MTKQEFFAGRAFRLNVEGVTQPTIYMHTDPEIDSGMVSWLRPDGTTEARGKVVDDNLNGVRVAATFFGNRVEAFLFYSNMMPA